MGEVSLLAFRLGFREIDVLLIARGNVAYDIWGGTLKVARHIVQEAEPGYVRLSDSTYALLTDVEGFVPCPPIETSAFGTIRSWSGPVVERTAAEVADSAEGRLASQTAE